MSNAEGSFGSGSGRGSDPVTAIFMAMRDAWLAGSAALKENVSGQAMPGGNPGAASPAASLLGPMIGMLGAMADMAAASRQHFEPPGAKAATGSAHGSAPGVQSDPAAADLLLPIGQAMVIAANRSVSYWLGLAQIFESHQAKLAQVVGLEATEGSPPGSERLVAADELRALLREVGDLATREARILQNELSTLDESSGAELSTTRPVRLLSQALAHQALRRRLFRHARANDAIRHHTTWFRVRDGTAARTHCALGRRLQRRVARSAGMAVPDRIEILPSADDLLLLSGRAPTDRSPSRSCSRLW